MSQPFCTELFVQLKTIYNIVKTSFLEYYGTISAIKNHTKTTGALTSNKHLLDRLIRTTKPSKLVYKLLSHQIMLQYPPLL